MKYCDHMYCVSGNIEKGLGNIGCDGGGKGCMIDELLTNVIEYARHGSSI